MARAEPPVRCVHLLPNTHDAGAQNQARYLLGELRDHQWLAPELAYFGAGRNHQEFVDLGLPMLHVARKRRFRFDLYGRPRRLRRAYRERPPRILHTWLLEGNVLGLVAARGWPDARVVITQRGSWEELDSRGLIALQRLLLRRADWAISNSAGGREMLASIGMPRERISIVANGIPQERVVASEDREAVRKQLGWEQREVVVWVGRANTEHAVQQKGLRGLVSSVELLRRERPKVLLALVGTTREEVEARDLGVPDWVMPIGWHSNPANLINAADVVVIPSRREGHSNVAGEALLAGLPVVTTDCGDHCAAVRRAGGRVVPVGDIDALSGALAEVLDRPPSSESVRSIARGELSVERMVEATLAVYRSVLEAPPR